MRKASLMIVSFIFVLSLSYYTFARSFVPPGAVIRCKVEDSILKENITCLGDNCKINVTRSVYTDGLYMEFPNVGTFSISDYGIVYRGFYRNFLQLYNQELINAVDSICADDIDDIKPILLEELESWSSNRRASDGGLTFEHYSMERELKSIESVKQILNCDYEDYKRVGDWLIINKTVRDYCESSYDFASSISHTKFLTFLISSPSIITLPFLVVYLAFIAISILFLFYLHKRNEIKAFFKPNKFNIVFTLILGFFSLFILGQIITWIITYYLIGSLINYIYHRTRNR